MLTLPRTRAVLEGGTVGGISGLLGGLAGVLLASRRYPTIRNLTLPMKAFLVSSTGTFTGIIGADHNSFRFQTENQQEKSYLDDRETRIRQEELTRMSTSEKVLDYLRREKYKIIGVTWVASMVGSFMLVGRNPYLTGQQKLVQARVYAQGLTLAVLCASAGFEIQDQKKGKGLLEAAKKKRAEAEKEHERGEDLWKDMVDAEEQREKLKEKSHERKKA